MKKVFFLFAIICGMCLWGVALEAKTLSNQKFDWYFKRTGGNNPPTTESNYAKLLETYGGYFIGDIEKKEVYLTFDNGYENGYTEKVLDVLKKENVPGAFFITGHYLKDQPDLVKRMVKEGHIVGNHSYTHPDFTTFSDEQLTKDLDRVKEEFTKLTGEKDMEYLRPPRGIFSERTLALTKKLGYTNVFWSLAYKDWEVNHQRGADYAYQQVMKQIHPGAILLLHTVSKDNADALERIIQDLKKEGYTFKSLDDLLQPDMMPEL